MCKGCHILWTFAIKEGLELPSLQHQQFVKLFYFSFSRNCPFIMARLLAAVFLTAMLTATLAAPLSDGRRIPAESYDASR